MGRLNRKLMGSPYCLSISPNKAPTPAVNRQMRRWNPLSPALLPFLLYIHTYNIHRHTDMRVKMEVCWVHSTSVITGIVRYIDTKDLQTITYMHTIIYIIHTYLHANMYMHNISPVNISNATKASCPPSYIVRLYNYNSTLRIKQRVFLPGRKWGFAGMRHPTRGMARRENSISSFSFLVDIHKCTLNIVHILNSYLKKPIIYGAHVHAYKNTTIKKRIALVLHTYINKYMYIYITVSDIVGSDFNFLPTRCQKMTSKSKIL